MVEASGAKREIWIDNAKVIACVLVVVEHFYKSLVASNILNASAFYAWFVPSMFNAHLFFFCSGFLYQMTAKVETLRGWTYNVKKKAIELGVPYFTFSLITYFLKTFFDGDVNSATSGIVQDLFIQPIGQYWFLYILFFFFLLIPTAANGKAMWIILGAGIALRLIIIPFDASEMPFLFLKLFQCSIYFILGMAVQFFSWSKKLSWKTAALGLFYFPFSLLYLEALEKSLPLARLISVIVLLLGILMVISAVYSWTAKHGQGKVLRFLNSYSLPIFLMHTMAAAGIRTILLRLSIASAAIHIPVGFASAILLPVFVGWVAKKYRVLEVFIYPTKLIKIKKPDTLSRESK